MADSESTPIEETITTELIEQLSSINSHPFLFIGSGVSRRYLGLENWSGLLERFSNEIPDSSPFQKHISDSNCNMSDVASLISEEFKDYWWSIHKDDHDKYKDLLITPDSPLKIAISEYLRDYQVTDNESLREEIGILSKLNVDGIITTNWDTFLEDTFGDYKTYIGQHELMLSNPQSIGEIYKIHGCVSKPNSLVLTSKDYTQFESKNAYLAAKLITIFIEHPIIFIGYSLSDKNIVSIIEAIIGCLEDNADLEQFKKNIIFISRARNASEINKSYTSILFENKTMLPLTEVKLTSFMPIYMAIDSLKRKMSTRLLRQCKEQLFELVKTENSDEKIEVIDPSCLESDSGVEFVIGFGVASNSRRALGYSSINVYDLDRKSVV